MKKKAQKPIKRIKVSEHAEERIADLEESYACLRESYLFVVRTLRIRMYVERVAIISLFVVAAVVIILKALGVL